VPEHPTVRIIRRTRAEIVPPDQLSKAQPLLWTTADGTSVHGLLYLPPGVTPDRLEQARELPPAIVHIHGGPTSQAIANFGADVQFFTTRGYTVLRVNHRGSTGYGRDYQDALRGTWGVADVEDTVSAARYLATERLADANRIVLMGGSSGGYTVLETLCRAPGVFRAGLCLYGISNLFTLVADTHKFEARYLDTLIGALPADSHLYRERSPLFHADLISDPVAIFQGSEDRVVPRDQSDAIVAALRRNGTPHEYHVYEGEGHGWRKPETIQQFYQDVEAFLKQYVLFA
jgi:dipeptidyl aminopeptidase/acylaminoacyl peptidase